MNIHVHIQYIHASVLIYSCCLFELTQEFAFLSHRRPKRNMIKRQRSIVQCWRNISACLPRRRKPTFMKYVLLSMPIYVDLEMSFLHVVVLKGLKATNPHLISCGFVQLCILSDFLNAFPHRRITRWTT